MAFYVAGAIPVIASLIMFAIPFLVPPKDDPFWNNPSSKQYLIQDSSTASSHTHTTSNDNNNNGINDENNNKDYSNNTAVKTIRSTTSVSSKDLCDIDSLDCIDIGGGDRGPLQPLQPTNNPNNTSVYASRFLITTKEDPSFTSICSFQLAAPTTTTNTNGVTTTGALSDNMSRLSVRGLGSISSFGSVVFSPVSPLNQAQSSNLLVVDRVTNV